MDSDEIQRANRYISHYGQGVGGNINVFRESGTLPTFRGAGAHSTGRYLGQHGSGIGSFFGGLARRLFPVVLKGAATFVGETVDRTEQGQSLGSAAVGAIQPTLGSMAKGALNAFTGQRGSGRRRKIKRVSVSAKKLTGGGKKRRSKKAVYKSRRKAKGRRRPRKFVSEGEAENVHYNF